MPRPEKIASASPHSAIPNASLNDDTWEAFIFGAHADAGPTTSTVENTLFDLVASGIRQRFSVISRTNVLAWANESVKTNDTCKELKALLDSGTTAGELPDSLLARLLKLRLLALKTEGIEIRNAGKAAKEQTESAAAPPEAVDPKAKPAKKDDKEKEKERAKSPAKKGAKGAPTKLETSSRPESAQVPQESSMRKTKLRERGVVKTDAKPATIGDEPENGPDAYYLLREFNGSDFYSTLMEETGLQVNLLFRIEPAADATSSGRSLHAQHNSPSDNPAYFTSYATAQKAPDTSLWKQTVFQTISPPAEPLASDQSLFDVTSRVIYGILKVRTIYDTFYAKDRVITIPELDPARGQENTRYFEHLLRGVPAEWMITPDVLLAMMLEQVVRTAPQTDDEEGLRKAQLSEKVEELAFLKQYFESATAGLATAGSSPTASADLLALDRLASSLDASVPAITVPMSDVHSLIAKRVHAPNIVGVNMTSAFEQLRRRFAAGRALEIIRKAMEKGEIEPSGGGREQLLCGSKLQTLTSVRNTEEGQRALRQAEFTSLLGENTESNEPINLEEWRWVEQFDEDTFMQVMESALVTSPEIKARFSERESALLIALTGPGRIGSTRASISGQNQARTKVGLGLFTQLHQDPQDYLQSGAKAEAPYVYSAGDQIIHFDEECEFMYPDSGAYIRSRKVSPMAGTVDNTITQRLTSTADGTAHSAVLAASDTLELGRAIRRDGTVIKHLRNGETHVLFPNGNVSRRSIAGDWTSVSSSGEVVGANDPPSALNVSEERDLATDTVIITRQDMVHVVHGKAQLTPARRRASEKHIGVYHINWVDGTLMMEDTTGSVFKVDEAGACSVALGNGPIETSNETPEMVHKSTKPTRSSTQVVSETAKRAPSNRFRNPPRLFLLQSSGQGLELLRDDDLQQFFKQQTANPAVQIIEEALVDRPTSVAVTVIAGAEPENGLPSLHSAPLVQYRQLIRNPIVPRTTVNSLVSEFGKLESRLGSTGPQPDLPGGPDQTAEEEESDAVADKLASSSQSAVSRTLERHMGTFGFNRAETEQRIKAKYALKEESVLSGCFKRSQGSRDGTTDKEGATVSGVLSPARPVKSSALDTASSRNKTRSLYKMLNDEFVPNFFKSPEAVAHFAQVPPAAAPADPQTTSDSASVPATHERVEVNFKEQDVLDNDSFPTEETAAKVAPGMKVDVKLKFEGSAAAFGKDGKNREDLQIITESHIFTVACTTSLLEGTAGSASTAQYEPPALSL
ncbi:Sperm-associated antigen 17 [Thoreauomyces humboldtii]|nr:Sperm-associated antigen 17 [Thoreauomyces humboldtii]